MFCAGDAYGGGRHDLVGEGVGHDAVLVDAGLVGEGVGSDDGLVGRAAEADELAEHLAGGVELGHDDVGGVGVAVAAGGDGGGDLFEGGVAGAFADAVDGALDLAGSAFDAGERVGDGHAEVVVAVGGEDDVFDAGDAGADGAEDGVVLGGGGVADGVGDVDGGGAGLDGDGDHLDEEVEVGAGAVFGGELDVVDEGAGEADGLGDAVEGLLAGDLELGFEVEVGGGEEDVDAVLVRRARRRGRRLRCPRACSGRGRRCGGRVTSRAMAWTELKSPSEAMAKPASRMSTPRRGELVGHAEFFCVVHGAAGGLFAVAEGGVEEDDLGVGGHRVAFGQISTFSTSGSNDHNLHAYDELLRCISKF